jgi:PAS domain S-box-containing protein
MSITLSEVEPTTGLAPDFIATSTLSTELTFARAEAASLRSQLAELQAQASLCEHNPNPVVQLDAVGRQLYANPAARRLREGLSRDDQVWVRQQLRAAAQTKVVDQHIRVGKRYFTLSAVFTAPPAGSTTLYLAETTERVLAERQLAEEQSFVKEILDTTSSSIFVRDTAGNLVFENRAATELRDQLGYLRAVDAQPPTARQAAERVRYLASDAQVLATGEQLTNENGVTLASGEVRYFHTVKRPLRRADGTYQVLGVSTDITFQKLASQALAQREKLYRDLMTYSQALICTHDMEGYLLSANPAASVLLGRPLGELPGLHLTQVCLYKQRDLTEQYLAYIDEVGSLRGTTGFINPSGQRCYLLHDNHVVREPGQPPYVIVYGQDVTEQQLAERELKRAKAAAEAAVTARENFLANMSHEIRTPLNGVLGMAAQLAKTTLDTRQRDFVHTIRRSGQHLLHVINDVLDMAKITSGKLELEVAAFNLCDSMAEAIRPLAIQAQEKGLDFGGIPLRATCAYPWVLGDAHRLNQILINLVSNAIKFTGPGGQVIVVGEQLAESATTLTVRFSVQDTGIGIELDKQELIFEGFTQAYTDTARRYGGTGLGLSISRALVTQLGGELTLRSALGQGSTFAFTLTLPKTTATDDAASQHPDSYDTGELHGRRLLVVEDNEINRAVARLMLEGWGAHVEEAEDGLIGVAMVQKSPLYDIVLMDIQLPGLNGLDATAAIRALPDATRAGVPIVALTANAFKADCERYLAAGMAACLAKPFEEEEVYRALVGVLASPPAYDLTKLRTLARGREEFVCKIVRSFLHNMPLSLAELHAAAAAQQWAAVGKTVHHIKPSLESLGVRDVTAAIEQLESARPTDYARLPAVVAHLTAQVQRALDTLPRELPADS